MSNEELKELEPFKEWDDVYSYICNLVKQLKDRDRLNTYIARAVLFEDGKVGKDE